MLENFTLVTILARQWDFVSRGKGKFLALAGLFWLVAAFNAQAIMKPGDRKVFTNSVIPLSKEAAASMRAVPPENQAEKMEIEVPLKMRSYPDLVEKIGREKIIPQAVLDRDYLPTVADYEKVKKWLASEGFEITKIDPDRLAVFAKGTVAQIQKSFQVEMVDVTVKGKDYHASHTHPSLPKAIAEPVLGINGLQPYLQMRKLSPTTPYAVAYSISDLLTAYNGKNMGLTGSGQTIAILIDTEPVNTDLTAFWTNSNIPQSLSNITEINVNNVSQAVLTGDDSGEETLDVEMTSGIAQAAKIRVYACGSIAYSSLDAGLQRIISDLPTQPQMHQLSISIGGGETDTGLYGTSQIQTDSQYFAVIAAAGVSVFVASGDGGSDPDSDGVTQVEYYSSDPNVTGVGGTTLKMSSTGTVTSETVWNTLTELNGGASGGGISQVFPKPSWQTGLGISGTETMRLVPDVAFVGDLDTGVYVYFGGAATKFGGTSVGAPSWAGFCALLNQARANAGQPPIGLLNPNIYPLSGTNNYYFREITSGNNGAYSAGAGYNECTGIGVPNMSHLVAALTGTNAGAPTISAISPVSGPVSTSVGISGLNFDNVTAVEFNGVSAPFKVNSSTEITGTVPSGASIGPITVITSSGTATSPNSFAVTSGSAITLFSTEFETSQGYTTGTLSGQQGWLKAGSGGNGVEADTADSVFSAYPNYQAFIGHTAPASGTTESVWQPINYTPTTGEIINFSVLMDIIDSTGNSSAPRDRFRWSVYNTAGTRLFSLEFDNSTNNINYVLDNNVTHLIGTLMANNTLYSIQMTFDFTRKVWTATLNGSTLVTNLPVATGTEALNLGSVRAEWVLNSTTAGNNYMLFDNYSITKSELALPIYTVTTSASPSTDGTTSGGGSYTNGTSVTVTATPYTNYNFVNWTGTSGTLSTSAAYTFTIIGNQNLAANFQPIPYTVSASILPSSGGTVSGAGVYSYDSTATLTATPAAGYGFSAWSESGSTLGLSSTYSFIVTGNSSLTANFQPAIISTWKSTYFTAAQLANSAISGDTASPSGDGICNLLAYAFDLNPTVVNSPSDLPQASVQNGYLTLTYTRNNTASDLTYTVQVSSDLQTWNSGSGYTSSPVIISDNGYAQTVQVSDLTPMSSLTKRFIRLKVSGP